MAGIIIPRTPCGEEKIALMREDSRFEIAADSDAESTAAASVSAIKSKPAPPKVDKMFLCGRCTFNCAYCGCRSGREDKTFYMNTPRELAELAVKSAKGKSGVFLSSAIYKTPDYTQELLAESVRIIRQDLGFGGYVHAKVMPGADPALIELTGRYASRMSVNIEVAKSSGYDKIAKQKSRESILSPMEDISTLIRSAKEEKRPFAVSQTTQIMAGSTGEDDRTIISLSKALYNKYRLGRVYYTPFQYRHEAKGYESENLPIVSTPFWRMARLYQADRLMQLYGFSPEELLPESSPFLERDLDPKTAWALRSPDIFPVEVNTADYSLLLRVPGIGTVSAKRIIEARRFCSLTHETLIKIGVSLKRSVYFITCRGKYYGGSALSSANLRDYFPSDAEQLTITGLFGPEP